MYCGEVVKVHKEKNIYIIVFLFFFLLLFSVVLLLYYFFVSQKINGDLCVYQMADPSESYQLALIMFIVRASFSFISPNHVI